MSNIELPNGIIKIQFKKKDDSIRDMICTVDPVIIGETEYNEFHNRTNKDGSPRKVSETTTNVWDIENQGWRSFINNNLISVEVHK